MELKARIAALDEVEESLRGLYLEDGEGYRLVQAKELGTLASSLAGARRELRSATEKLKGFEIDGKMVDPTELRGLMTELSDLRARKAPAEPAAGSDAAIEKLNKEWNAKFEKVQKQLDDERHKAEAATRRVRQTQIERALEEEATAQRVLPEFFDDLKLRATQFGVLDDDSIVVVSSDGKPVETDDGKYITPKDLVAKLVKEKPRWLQPSGGGGSRGTIGGPTRPGMIARDDDAALLANLKDVASGKVQVQ